MALISVIIPAYNVEKYIGECLDSIVNQTMADLEIICVDDGSSDSTPDIFNEYASKDDRIKVIQQENKGPSAARNTGLRNATGQYVYFMDSDDYLEADALKELYDISEKDSLDMVIFKATTFDEDTGERYTTSYYDMDKIRDFSQGRVFNYKDLGELMFSISVSPWSKFFKASVVKDLSFIEGIIFEDNIFFIESVFKSKRMYFYDRYLYNRRVRSGSLMTSGKNFTDYIFVANKLIDLTKEHGMFDVCKYNLFDKIIISNFLRFSQSMGESKLDYFDKMKKDFLDKKEEYAQDDIFEVIPERPREIFDSCIRSENAREFELSINLYDTTHKLERTQDLLEEKKQELIDVKKDKRVLFKTTQKLSEKLNETAHEKKQLAKDKKEYKQEIKDLKYVNEQLMTSTSWKVTKPMRAIGKAAKK